MKASVDSAVGGPPTAELRPELDAATRSRDVVLSLWDWRQRITDLYGRIRTCPSKEGWDVWRTTRDALFREHPQTPLEADQHAAFRSVPLFPYDPSLRALVETRPIEDRAPVRVEAGRDGSLVMTPFCRTDGLAEKLGGELTLYWIGGYGGGVFLPFRDATSGRETYGGGRYLLDTIKGADLGRAPDGRLILDFNFAYNPSCSYSDLWVCPLSPPENRLPVEVRGGEMKPAA